MPKRQSSFNNYTAIFAAALVLGLAYASSFQGVFVFDDHYAIVQNPTIRDLAHLDRILLIPGAVGGTVGGRPIANLTLAVNYAISGTHPWSYHAVNLAIHFAAALVLFGVVRRTLRLPRFDHASTPNPTWIAWSIALLWALHPLQTESVTYIVQRVESLTGLFYLLTAYCFIRSLDTHARRWTVGAFGFCLCGMGTKEVMVTAPLVILLYDRTFVGRSWREVWGERWRIHGALLSTWIFLAVLVAGTEGRGGSAGFGGPISWTEYAQTQCVAIVHYLRLALWPHPLVFDYGVELVREPLRIVVCGLILLGLVGATVWAWARRPVLGFLGACFFLFLAPSSSVVPIATQTMAEHRMYLALIPLVAVAVYATVGFAGTAGRVVMVILTLAAGVATASRNRVYRSELALWQDTVAHAPSNPRARTNLGLELAAAGRLQEATAEYLQAVQLDPKSVQTLINLCAVLREGGRPEEALTYGQRALELDANSSAAHVNVANAFVDLRQPDAAVVHFRAALKLAPAAGDVHRALATLLLEQNKPAEAVRHAEWVAQLEPDSERAWLLLARAHLAHGEWGAARTAGEHAVALNPKSPDAFYLLGIAAVNREAVPEAVDYFGRAVTIAPTYVAARTNLANALLMVGRLSDAMRQYEEVLRQNPGNAAARENLARALELQQSAQ